MNAAIRRYVAKGDYDADCRWWPGSDYIEKENGYHRALREALIAEVRSRAAGAAPPAPPAGLEVEAFTRKRVRPMVDGLFPKKEREAVLALLERSVIFLTPDNIWKVLSKVRGLGTAWSLADLYLGSVGRKGLSLERGGILGLSQETTCYVSLSYFVEEDPFADYVVHEAAHVFHNWKRQYAGLPYTRHKEWLLQIEFRKREIFAYSCEFYSRILAMSHSKADRIRLAEQCIENLHLSPAEDQAEVIDALREAAGAVNGWKRILARCAAPPPLRRKARQAWLVSLTEDPLPPSCRRILGSACASTSLIHRL